MRKRLLAVLCVASVLICLLMVGCDEKAPTVNAPATAEFAGKYRMTGFYFEGEVQTVDFESTLFLYDNGKGVMQTDYPTGGNNPAGYKEVTPVTYTADGTCTAYLEGFTRPASQTVKLKKNGNQLVLVANSSDGAQETHFSYVGSTAPWDNLTPGVYYPTQACDVSWDRDDGSKYNTQVKCVELYGNGYGTVTTTAGAAIGFKYENQQMALFGERHYGTPYCTIGYGITGGELMLREPDSGNWIPFDLK